MISKIKRLVLRIISLFKQKNYIPIVTQASNEKMFEGKTALVVGGSGGIGIAIAKKLMASGCTVIITGTNEAKLKIIANENGIERFAVLNLKDISNFSKKISEIENDFGCLDILVCCSGIHVKRGNFNYLTVSPEEYDSIMDVNMKGTYFICQNIAKQMIQNKKNGHILVISSSRSAEPSWSPYSLSKRSLNGYIEGMAKELLQYGIVVNGIAPGPTATSMQGEAINGSIYTNQTLSERLTLPEEVAEYACMLVSPLGNTIVGQTLFMSSGRGIIDIR